MGSEAFARVKEKHLLQKPQRLFPSGCDLYLAVSVPVSAMPLVPSPCNLVTHAKLTLWPRLLNTISYEQVHHIWNGTARRCRVYQRKYDVLTSRLGHVLRVCQELFWSDEDQKLNPKTLSLGFRYTILAKFVDTHRRRTHVIRKKSIDRSLNSYFGSVNACSATRSCNSQRPVVLHWPRNGGRVTCVPVT